jgi:hypothetical protein
MDDLCVKLNLYLPYHDITSVHFHQIHALNQYHPLTLC